MRRILLLTLGAVVVAIAAYGVIGSSAMFADDEAVPFAAQAADDPIDFGLDVGPENPIGSGELRTVEVYDDEIGYIGVEWTVDDLYPGVWSTPYLISIRNHSATVDPSSPADYVVSATKLSSDPDPDFWNNMQVLVETGTCETSGQDLTISDPITTVYEGALWDLSFTNSTVLEVALDPGYVHCYRVSFRLSPSAGNELFAGESAFEILVHATPAS